MVNSYIANLINMQFQQLPKSTCRKIRMGIAMAKKVMPLSQSISLTCLNKNCKHVNYIDSAVKKYECQLRSAVVTKIYFTHLNLLGLFTCERKFCVFHFPFSKKNFSFIFTNRIHMSIVENNIRISKKNN